MFELGWMSRLVHSGQCTHRIQLRLITAWTLFILLTLRSFNLLDMNFTLNLLFLLTLISWVNFLSLLLIPSLPLLVLGWILILFAHFHLNTTHIWQLLTMSRINIHAKWEGLLLHLVHLIVIHLLVVLIPLGLIDLTVHLLAFNLVFLRQLLFPLFPPLVSIGAVLAEFTVASFRREIPSA